MILNKAFAAVVVLLLASAPAAPAGAETRTWRAETSGAPWSITGDVPTARDLRFEVRPGDHAAWDLTHHHPAERAEISDFAHKEAVDADIWFAFDLTVERGPPVTSQWLVIGQLHATEDPGTMPASPPWAQELDAGNVFRILVRTTTERSLRKKPPAIVLYSDPAFQRGRTYRFVYQLRYSQTAGRLRAWRDGRLVAELCRAARLSHPARSVFPVRNLPAACPRDDRGTLLGVAVRRPGARTGIG